MPLPGRLRGGRLGLLLARRRLRLLTEAILKFARQILLVTHAAGAARLSPDHLG